MDAYEQGLNGRQAAWAARKYRGHRVLPMSIMNDLLREGRCLNRQHVVFRSYECYLEGVCAMHLINLLIPIRITWLMVAGFASNLRQLL